MEPYPSINIIFPKKIIQPKTPKQIRTNLKTIRSIRARSRNTKSLNTQQKPYPLNPKKKQHYITYESITSSL